MKKIIIKPSNTKTETLLVISFSAIIFLIAFILINFQQKDIVIKKQKDFEISVFKDLTTIEQGIYSDLFTSKDDLLIYFEFENAWQTVQQLEENFTAPFVKDLSWKNRGKFIWAQKIYNIAKPDDSGMHRDCAFLGYSEKDQTGSFLLILYEKDANEELEHPDYEIWYNKKITKEFPIALIQDILIKSGWKKAVPYTGTEEIKRLKGE